MCFGCSKEPSHWDVWDSSFEYQQHMFWVRNKKNSFPIRTLIWSPAKVNFKKSQKRTTMAWNIPQHAKELNLKKNPNKCNCNSTVSRVNNRIFMSSHATIIQVLPAFRRQRNSFHQRLLIYCFSSQQKPKCLFLLSTNERKMPSRLAY